MAGPICLKKMDDREGRSPNCCGLLQTLDPSVDLYSPVVLILMTVLCRQGES